THEATLALTGNGGQRFQVPIKLELSQPRFGPGRHFLGPLLLGLLTGVLLRLMILPLDLLARGFGTALPASYVGRFRFMLGWLGARGVGGVLWKKRERKLIPAGLLVGAVTGLMLSATLANLVLVVDGLAARLAPELPLPTWAASFGGWMLLGLAGVLLLRL